MTKIKKYRLSESFFKKIKNRSLTGNRIVSHFEKINFDYTNFFKILSQNFFLEFLKISVENKFYISILKIGHI